MVDFSRSEAKAWALEHIKDFYMCPITPMKDDFTMDEEGIRYNIENTSNGVYPAWWLAVFIAEGGT